MNYLITQIQDYFNEQAKEEKKWPKNSFWPSETETNVFDIYHKWMRTPVTNEIGTEKRMMFEVAKLLEKVYCDKFEDMSILKGTQVRLEMEREGVRITGFIDAVIYEGDKKNMDKMKKIEAYALKENNTEILELIKQLTISDSLEEVPVEIKSIYGTYAAKEMEAGVARQSNLNQIAIYMDFMNVDKGYLLYVDRGTGASWQFIVTRKDKQFTCNANTFTLDDIYKKWNRLYHNNIVKHIEPKSEYKYKYDLNEIDWKSQTKSAITQARNNKKVIGSWMVPYSSYFDLLLKREGTTKGYTPDEIKLIHEYTKGYTSKEWKK